ncbi:hypothetical protein H4R99_004088 [Coemansia sp. RSA 1722]|nr:hypothetical protein LPJ57_001583 [Coemansia sp. RSA 486]KAJ2598468.1 hypothetical protein H4R99_004088 [Coemansia sp. RSA 1722]
MSTELNVFIIVAISVSAVTIAVMILARRFRGPQQQQQQQDGSNTPQSQRYRIQPSRRRIVQFRPSNRPVKPYNPFSKDELQLLPTVNLTQADVDRLNMQKPQSFSKEDVTKELTEEAVAFDNDDGKVLESGLRYASPECTICLVSYEKADVVRILSCSHTYHADCIDVWLTERSARCPICKMDIRQALGLEKRRLARTSAGANPGTLEEDDDEEEAGDDESNTENSGAHHVVEIRRPQPALIPSNV